jgi:hypothetical protein
LKPRPRLWREKARQIRAEAKALREKARQIRADANCLVAEIVGTVNPFTETYTFQCDEASDSELAGLGTELVADRLFNAIGTSTAALAECDRGYWGDLMFLGRYQRTPPGPGSWTRMGSADWLGDLFVDDDASTNAELKA